MRAPMLTLALCAALAACAPAQGISGDQAGSPPADEAAEMAVAAAAPAGGRLSEQVFAHMGQLQAVADLNGGTRASGTPGYAASLDYVDSVLVAAGYETARQTLQASHPSTGEAAVAVVNGRVPAPAAAIAMVGSARAEAVTAPLALTPDPAGCAASDYAGTDSAVVLVERGGCTFGDKARLAAEAGALALLVSDDEGTEPIRGDLADGAGLIPALGLTHADGAALRAGAQSGELIVRVTVDPGHETLPVTNLLAWWPEAEDAPVLIGAHLDSVPEGAGINDNASGVAVALTVAERLAEAGGATPRFAFWDGEQLGQLGSTAYLQSIDGPDRESIGAYLNLDMVASPFGEIAVYGSGAPAEALVHAVGEAARTIDLLISSDNASFVAAGIPTAGLHTGSIYPLALSGEIFDSAAAVVPDPCYRKACDALSAVDTPAVRARLDLIAEAALHAAQELVTS